MDTLREAASSALEELGREGWPRTPPQSETLRATLMPLCAHYLARERSRDRTLDPVARFHLGNGARLERLNWLGDVPAQEIGIAECSGRGGQDGQHSVVDVHEHK